MSEAWYIDTDSVTNIQIPLGLNEETKTNTMSNSHVHDDVLKTPFLQCATQIANQRSIFYWAKC